MLVNFNDVKEITVPGMNNGTGTMTAKMYMDEQGKIIPCSIHAGSSIGLHKHETSDDINYVLSGNGKAICDGQEEILSVGTCHICKRGSEHSIVNAGNSKIVYIKSQEAYSELCKLREQTRAFLESEERFQRVNELIKKAKISYANSHLHETLRENCSKASFELWRSRTA